MKIGQAIRNLCSGNAVWHGEWIDGPTQHALVGVLGILAGCGLYGATIGIWRAPLQGVYTAIKFPLLIVLTTLGNAAINGMLAQVLGARISFRQSAMAILTSFSIAGLILGSLAPVALFVTFNTPPLQSEARFTAHAVILLTHVILIAFAGTVANLRLYSLLVHLSGSRTVGRRILLSWLMVNLLLGSQLAWNMRPFIGSPSLPVRFLRPDAFRGSFYESVYNSAARVMRASRPESHNRRQP